MSYKKYLLILTILLVPVDFICYSQSVFLPDSLTVLQDSDVLAEADLPVENFHQVIKRKFIEGSPVFMSFIALVFVVGLAFCLERIIYLSLSRINYKKMLRGISEAMGNNQPGKALEIAENTQGPIGVICYEALSRIDESPEVIEKTIISYGSVEAGYLEKNFSWITLFIAVAPSLGFLGTVIGMIEAFDKIEKFADINPAIVASGMKIALITTVGGLIVAIILQLFYNYILTKEEKILNEMEEASVGLMDIIIRYKKSFNK